MSDTDATADDGSGPPADDDVVVSAYLDGEATPDERARVEADPALLSRVDELQRLAARVAVVAPAADRTREAHLARAREVFAAGADRGPTDAVTPVVDLAAARHRRRTALLGVAAAILVILLGVGVITQLGDDEPEVEVVGSAIDDGDEPSASNPPSAADQDTDEGAALEEDAAAPELSAGGDAATAALPDLGSFDSRAELSQRLTASLETALADDDARSLTPQSTVQSFGAAPACVTSIEASDTELGSLRYAATATLSGQPLLVVLFATDPGRSANGSLRLYVVDAASCTPIDDGVQTFDP
jgi:hypothetical protein